MTFFVQRTPKRGFTKPKREFCHVNLGDLQRNISSGRLVVPTDRPLTVKDFFEAKLITLRQRHCGVKLLGRGSTTFTTPVRIEVQDATSEAIKAIERAGGSISTVYYSRLALRAVLKPDRILAKGQLLPRPSLPPPKLMSSLYLKEEKRGYLNSLQPGDVIRPHEQPPHVRKHRGDR